MFKNLCSYWGYEMGTPLGWYGQGIAEPIAATERRDNEGLGYDWQRHKVGFARSKNQKLIIPRDLTNFISVGTLDPNKSQTSAQSGLHQTSPLPTEEWVCV